MEEITNTYNRERQAEIHEKGLDLFNFASGKMRIGPKSFEDATLNLGSIKKYYP